MSHTFSAGRKRGALIFNAVTKRERERERERPVHRFFASIWMVTKASSSIPFLRVRWPKPQTYEISHVFPFSKEEIVGATEFIVGVGSRYFSRVI